jgi:cell division protein FtsL
MYVEGSAVRKLNTQPEWEEPVKRKRAKVSKKAQQNRVKATRMSLGYVVFLTAVSVVTLFLCVSYVQLKAQLTTQTKSIARQESALSTLKGDNDAFYNTVNASVDMEHIKDVAINKLGMKTPTADQIITFDTAGNSYVRQYQDVPSSK